MTDALQNQVGGLHYRNKAIQPIEIWMANEYDGCIGNSIKYVTRHPEKAGRIDLEKAAHFCELRVATLSPLWRYRGHVGISIMRYIEANALPKEEAEIVSNLHHWGVGLMPQVSLAEASDMIRRKIATLITLRYPGA